MHLLIHQLIVLFLGDKMDNKKNSICKNLVWKYFNKKDRTSATCILCKKVLKHGGNTTNLKQHLQRKHILFRT